jgi:DNA-binding NarL/FixJ family response regulator
VREGLKRRVSADVAYELARHDALTEREIEVLKLIAAGFSNKLVAERLSITEDTVKGHVRNILRFMNFEITAFYDCRIAVIRKARYEPSQSAPQTGGNQ